MDRTAPIGALCSGPRMANSVDFDRSAPVGALCSGPRMVNSVH